MFIFVWLFARSTQPQQIRILKATQHLEYYCIAILTNSHII